MRAALVGLVMLVACAPPHPPGASDRARFDAWFATSGVTIIHQTPVPCLGPDDPGCGAAGRYIPSTKTIYLDDVEIAKYQASDPSHDAALQIEYHEKSHAAFFIIGEHLNQSPGSTGIARLWWEREAQCGMRFLVGGWTPPGTNPDVYWICPDAKVAETRWIWASHGVI